MTPLNPRDSLPMGYGSDSPSAVQPDTIQPATGATLINGAAPSHPELAADLKDARLVRVARPELSGAYTAAPDASNPETLRARAPGAFLPSSELN